MRHPIMSFVTRSDRGESVHLTAAVLIGPAGETVFTAGLVDIPFYMRSAAKPFQAIAMLESGAFQQYGLTAEDLAIACASHSGEPRHLEQVRAFQARAGVEEDQLMCGPHWPLHRPSEEALIRQGNRPMPLHNNCSGKHTGFLAAARALGAPAGNYLSPDHAVQRLILGHMRRLSGLEDLPTGLDGCSAPTYFLTLTEMARLVQRLAAGNDPLLAPQFDAMVQHPFLVAGTERFDTDFTSVLAGRAVSKEGDEGLQTVAIRAKDGGGYGLALKVLDGHRRPKAQVAPTILRQARLLDVGDLEHLAAHYRPTYRNRADRDVGILVTQLPREG